MLPRGLLQLAAWSAGTLLLLQPSAHAAAAKPHVIFALIDDWGSYDVAWRQQELGRTPQLKTPVLDALVQEGVKLDDYYVQHICTPTRQALMSGRYQIHTGLQHGIIQNSQKSCLPPKFGTMADAFKSGGYSTHMIGKWHLGLYKDACLPWKRGFDTYYGYLTGSELHFTKEQRSARGSPGNASQKVLYPDFRRETGPISSVCVTVPPHAPGSRSDGQPQ
jgi:arylsulfatase A-like enzyme